MKRRLHRHLRQWLEHEEIGLEAAAEESLRKVLALLPEERVPTGFADRVLARAGLAPAPTPGLSTAAVWCVRAAIGLCLMVTALFLLVIPSYLPAMLGIFHLGRITGLGLDALVGVVEQLGTGLVIWRAISAVGAILSSVLSSPPYIAALALGALLCMAALRALHEVFSSERSSRYVGSV